MVHPLLSPAHWSVGCNASHTNACSTGVTAARSSGFTSLCVQDQARPPPRFATLSQSMERKFAFQPTLQRHVAWPGQASAWQHEQFAKQCETPPCPRGKSHGLGGAQQSRERNGNQVRVMRRYTQFPSAGAGPGRPERTRGHPNPAVPGTILSSFVQHRVQSRGTPSRSAAEWATRAV